MRALFRAYWGEGEDISDPALVQRVLDDAGLDGKRLVAMTSQQDVKDEPTLPLREVMALAADRDAIALQYVNGFQQVLTLGVPSLARRIAAHGNLEDAIIGTYLESLAHHPDSLIARKRGAAPGQQAEKGLITLPGESERQIDDLAGSYLTTKLDAMVLSHGHYDHFGGMVGFLSATQGQRKPKLPLYIGGEECFCSRQFTAGPTPLNFGALDRKAIAEADLVVTTAEGPAVIADHAFVTGHIPCEREIFLRPGAKARRAGSRRPRWRSNRPERRWVPARRPTWERAAGARRNALADRR